MNVFGPFRAEATRQGPTNTFLRRIGATGLAHWIFDPGTRVRVSDALLVVGEESPSAVTLHVNEQPFTEGR